MRRARPLAAVDFPDAAALLTKKNMAVPLRVYEILRFRKYALNGSILFMEEPMNFIIAVLLMRLAPLDFTFLIPIFHIAPGNVVVVFKGQRRSIDPRWR